MPKSRKSARPDTNAMSYQLRRAIEARTDLTVYALAQLADVVPPVISRFLAGERGLTLASADKIALALGLRLVPGPKRRGKAAAEQGGEPYPQG
jgi:hypothetical protein